MLFYDHKQPILVPHWLPPLSGCVRTPHNLNLPVNSNRTLGFLQFAKCLRLVITDFIAVTNHRTLTRTFSTAI